MNLGEINFCGKKAFNIKQDSVKEILLNSLDKHFGLRIMQKHHENYKASLLPRLQTIPHYLSTKTNSSSYFLFFTKFKDDNVSVFIDKKIQNGYLYPRMILTDFEFDDKMFVGTNEKGTVFDGEMVCANGDWIFLINDVVLHHVKNFTSSFHNRLNLIYSVLNTLFEPKDTDICSFQVKRYFKYTEINELEEFIANLPYTCRGLYFKPVFETDFQAVMYNFEQTFIQKHKFKYSEDSSNPKFFCNVPGGNKQKQPKFDNNNIKSDEVLSPPMPMLQSAGVIYWWTRKTPTDDVYELYDDNDNMLNPSSPSFIGYAHIPNLPTSRYMRNMFSNSNMFTRKQFPFSWDKVFHKWTPIIH